MGAFLLTLNKLPDNADPGALFAGLAGAISGLVGAYFGVAVGGGTAQAVQEAKDGQMKAMGALADVARLLPAPQTDEEKAALAQEAIAAVSPRA
jgi:hypothetical protein